MCIEYYDLTEPDNAPQRMSSDGDPINQARLAGAARGLTPEGLATVTWCGFALACCFVALRLYVRTTESRRLFSDDYWLLAALFFLLTQATLQTLQNHSLYYLIYASAGEVPAGKALLDEGNIYVRYQFVIIVLFWTITWSVKYSFLALYYRLFNGLAVYRKIWWTVVILAALAYVGCWIASVWTCHPPSTYFDFGQCAKPIDLEGSVISISYSTAVDVLTDLMIMALPIKLLSFLHVSRVQRLALIGIFSVGCIVIACALVRLTQIIAHARSDPVGLAVWGVVESSMSVVVGSLPALKSFFGRAWDRTVRKYSGQLGSSSVRWSDRVGMPGRVVLSDPEKSWASTRVIPLNRSPGEGSDPSTYEQSPITPHFHSRGGNDDEHTTRNNSSSTTGLAPTARHPHDRAPSG